MNPIKEQKTIFNQAQESMRSEEAASSNGKAETGIMLGLALSSLFTIIYMIVALGGSLVGLGWASLVAYIIGGLLGLAAIMPGEAAVWIWKTKLQSDYEINGTQVTVAWISGLAAAVSAAVSTVSFFAYLLQGLMPGWYNPDTAAGVNVANIAVGWAIFGLAVFVYYAAGDSSKRNRNRAKALHVARTAQDQMIAGIAQGTKDKIEELIQGMGENNIFVDDALEQVARAMGLNDERTKQVRDLAKPQQQSRGDSWTVAFLNARGEPWWFNVAGDFDTAVLEAKRTQKKDLFSDVVVKDRNGTIVWPSHKDGSFGNWYLFRSDKVVKGPMSESEAKHQAEEMNEEKGSTSYHARFGLGRLYDKERHLFEEGPQPARPTSAPVSSNGRDYHRG